MAANQNQKGPHYDNTRERLAKRREADAKTSEKVDKPAKVKKVMTDDES